MIAVAGRVRDRLAPIRNSAAPAALALAGIAAGGVLWAVREPAAASALWAATTALVLVPLVAAVYRQVRSGTFGADAIALLAMAGSLALGQFLAGAVIGLMLAGGQALEAYAANRARHELSKLLERAPRAVHRYQDGSLTSPALTEVGRGDLLLVKPGEVVPVDGVVAEGVAVLDESALTGEARPVERMRGDTVRSGAVNAGAPFDLRAVATAHDSTFAAIVRLVESAQRSKAPFVRLADRYATWFLPLALAVAGVAWAVSHDPVRALAVLVVATPCPLILAAPVAIVAGISRAAGRGVIVKGGAPLEALAIARTAVFDKTGTLTAGMPRISRVESFGALGEDRVLCLAASLDQVSSHVFAAPIVAAARERDLPLEFPEAVEEIPGRGIRGRVEGSVVAVGKATWVSDGPLTPAASAVRRRAEIEGVSAVFVAVDGVMAGALLLEDPVRPETPAAVRALRRSGIARVVLLSGDRRVVADSVGRLIGADEVLAEQGPEDKVASVIELRRRQPVVMVGDGINDAPALAAADVGIAIAARGATAASEAADIVITVDRLDRVALALRIARRSRSIARQSAGAGMLLSLAAMGAAALGFLPPVAGALLQEAIDVAVILNALRALGGDAAGVPDGTADLRDRFSREHHDLLPLVDRVRDIADRLPGDGAMGELRELHTALETRLLAHEHEEATSLYPMVDRRIGSPDATVPMIRAHVEIDQLVAAVRRLLDLTSGPPPPADLREFHRLLYGLHAVLRLHFAEEEELYMALAQPDGSSDRPPPAERAGGERAPRLSG